MNSHCVPPPCMEIKKKKNCWKVNPLLGLDQCLNKKKDIFIRRPRQSDTFGGGGGAKITDPNSLPCSFSSQPPLVATAIRLLPSAVRALPSPLLSTQWLQFLLNYYHCPQFKVIPPPTSSTSSCLACSYRSRDLEELNTTSPHSVYCVQASLLPFSLPAALWPQILYR